MTSSQGPKIDASSQHEKSSRGEEDRTDKIGVLIATPWDEAVGGVASVVGSLARYLEEAGHDVRFFHPGEHSVIREVVTAHGYPGFRMRLRGWKSSTHPFRAPASFLVTLPWALFQLRRVVEENQLQIVNLHYPTPSMVSFAILRRLGLIRLVLSLHGSDVIRHREIGGDEPTPSYDPELRILLSAADRIVLPSLGLLKVFNARFPEYEQKAVSIANALDDSFAQAIKNSAIPDGPPYLLCVAHHNVVKGLDVLLRAYCELRERQGVSAPDLVLVGEGPLTSSLEELAISLGVEGFVRFLGFCPRSEVASVMRGCEALVLPSRAEAFGLVVIEALAVGKPVVATRVGGIPEILEGTDFGLLVPPDDVEALADALESVLNDRAMRNFAESHGPDWVDRHFDYTQNGARYEALFRSLISRRDP